MVLYTYGNKAIFRCKACKKTESMRTGLIIEGSRLALSSIHAILCAWWHGTTISMTAQSTNVQLRTVWSWFKLCRAMCVSFFIDNPILIGGQGITVEIDEALVLGRRKYNRGHVRQQIWIVAGVERRGPYGQIGRMFAVPVVHRTKAILKAIIVQHVLPLSTIITDQWRGYNGVADTQNRYTHLTVNHSRNFVDPVTGAHTQAIEGTWTHLRNTLPRNGLRFSALREHIAEFLYRRICIGEEIALRDLYSFSPSAQRRTLLAVQEEQQAEQQAEPEEEEQPPHPHIIHPVHSPNSMTRENESSSDDSAYQAFSDDEDEDEDEMEPPPRKR